MNTTMMMTNPALRGGMGGIGNQGTVLRRPSFGSQARLKAYRRALRAAEMAAWNRIRPVTTHNPGTASDETAPRNVFQNAREVSKQDDTVHAVFAVLVFAGVTAVAFGGTAALRFGDHWHRFVELVRNWIG